MVDRRHRRVARVAGRGDGSARRGRAADTRRSTRGRLVEQASGAEGSELALVLDTPATQRGVAHFDAMLARRADGRTTAVRARRVGVSSPRSLRRSSGSHSSSRDGGRRRARARASWIAEPPPTAVPHGGRSRHGFGCDRPGARVRAADGRGVGDRRLRRRPRGGPGEPGRPRARRDAGAAARGLVVRRACRPSCGASSTWSSATRPTSPTTSGCRRRSSDWEPRSALRAGPSGTEAYERSSSSSTRRGSAPGGSLVLEIAPAPGRLRRGAARGSQGYVDVEVAPGPGRTTIVCSSLAGPDVAVR